MPSFNFSSVPLQSNCRWFVRHGGKTMYARGFKSKAEASSWIDAFADSLAWRAGFTFRLKTEAVDIQIVSRSGELAQP